MPSSYMGVSTGSQPLTTTAAAPVTAGVIKTGTLTRAGGAARKTRSQKLADEVYGSSSAEQARAITRASKTRQQTLKLLEKQRLLRIRAQSDQPLTVALRELGHPTTTDPDASAATFSGVTESTLTSAQQAAAQAVADFDPQAVARALTQTTQSYDRALPSTGAQPPPPSTAAESIPLNPLTTEQTQQAPITVPPQEAQAHIDPDSVFPSGGETSFHPPATPTSEATANVGIKANPTIQASADWSEEELERRIVEATRANQNLTPETMDAQLTFNRTSVKLYSQTGLLNRKEAFYQVFGGQPETALSTGDTVASRVRQSMDLGARVTSDVDHPTTSGAEAVTQGQVVQASRGASARAASEGQSYHKFDTGELNDDQHALVNTFLSLGEPGQRFVSRLFDKRDVATLTSSGIQGNRLRYPRDYSVFRNRSEADSLIAEGRRLLYPSGHAIGETRVRDFVNNLYSVRPVGAEVPADEKALAEGALESLFETDDDLINYGGLDVELNDAEQSVVDNFAGLGDPGLDFLSELFDRRSRGTLTREGLRQRPIDFTRDFTLLRNRSEIDDLIAHGRRVLYPDGHPDGEVVVRGLVRNLLTDVDARSIGGASGVSLPPSRLPNVEANAQFADVSPGSVDSDFLKFLDDVDLTTLGTSLTTTAGSATGPVTTVPAGLGTTTLQFSGEPVPQVPVGSTAEAIATQQTLTHYATVPASEAQAAASRIPSTITPHDATALNRLLGPDTTQAAAASAQSIPLTQRLSGSTVEETQQAKAVAQKTNVHVNVTDQQLAEAITELSNAPSDEFNARVEILNEIAPSEFLASPS